jgi:5-(carboxyamino)imidazole ribonucleotide synthase
MVNANLTRVGTSVKLCVGTVKRVGIVGGGQLAWMMADAAKKLGLELIIQTPSLSDPAVTIAVETILASVVDAQATASLANKSDVVTFENEFVDLEALGSLAERGVCFRPALSTLLPLLSKYDQRCFLRDRGLPTPEFSRLSEVLGTIRFPAVLKTCRNGYDGYGTFIVKTQAEFDAVLEKVPPEELLLEDFVPFVRELAVMVARSISGEVAVYPIVQTHQENAVCRWVKVPIALPAGLEQEIGAIARTVVESLQLVGIVGIEFFQTQDDRVLVNEIAPRTHNSGHYTLDASVTSQFEQQLRAVAGLTLGSPALNCAGAVMVNLLGFEAVECDYAAVRSRLEAIPGAIVHWYGKSESRVGRKLGHVTVCLDQADVGRMDAVVREIQGIWYG